MLGKALYIKRLFDIIKTMNDPVLQEGTPEFQLRKQKIEIWEEFDAFISSFVDKHNLDKNFRAESFQLMIEYVHKKLYS